MRSFTLGASLSLIVLCGASATSGRPALAADYCADAARHRVAQKAPAELAPAVAKAFGVGLDALDDAAFVRCVGPKLLACWVDAISTAARLTRSGRCPARPPIAGRPRIAGNSHGRHRARHHLRLALRRRRAVTGKVVMPVDRQGYVAENWKDAR